MDTVRVTLFDDFTNTRTMVVTTAALADLFSYAHQWGLHEHPKDPVTLSFSSMLASMIAGADPIKRLLAAVLAIAGSKLIFA